MSRKSEKFRFKKVFGAKILIECNFYFNEEISHYIDDKIISFSTKRTKELRKELFQLSPSEFEEYVAKHFDKMGYDVQLTGPTCFKDGGIDLVAIDKRRKTGSILIGVQVKHHKGDFKTGRKAVNELLAWRDTNFRIGVLVTNSTFTKDALWVASQVNNRPFIRLRDFNDLVRWENHDYWSKENWREIPHQINLAPGVNINIPEMTLPNSARK